MLIKIKLRKNLLYLLVYYISAFVNNNIISNLVHQFSGFIPSYIRLYLYPIQNIIGGLIIFLYQKYSTRKKEKPKYFGINLIHNKRYIARDRKFKKILLIFFASFFNYYGFMIKFFYKSKYISTLMDYRLSSIQIIVSALIFVYAFGFKNKKHHKVSLIIIIIFFGILILVDIISILYYNYQSIKAPLLHYFLTLYYYMLYSFNDCIEKYLVDYNYMNPFIILIIEGVFEFLLMLSFIIIINPFEGLNKEILAENKAEFIIVFILFTLLQIIVNIYRIYCNAIYTPMARSLIDYLINPLINIFIFFWDLAIFRSVVYFIIAEITCIVLSFFGCVFNEYIILYFCGLEHDTQDEISDRANNQFQNELDDIKDISGDKDTSENDDDIKKSNTNISFGGYDLGI